MGRHRAVLMSAMSRSAQIADSCTARCPTGQQIAECRRHDRRAIVAAILPLRMSWLSGEPIRIDVNTGVEPCRCGAAQGRHARSYDK
jgi:hypothetical protein